MKSFFTTVAACMFLASAAQAEVELLKCDGQDKEGRQIQIQLIQRLDLVPTTDVNVTIYGQGEPIQAASALNPGSKNGADYTVNGLLASGISIEIFEGDGEFKLTRLEYYYDGNFLPENKVELICK